MITTTTTMTTMLVGRSEKSYRSLLPSALVLDGHSDSTARKARETHRSSGNSHHNVACLAAGWACLVVLACIGKSRSPLRNDCRHTDGNTTPAHNG
jgi:hypothetical protein